MAVGEIEGVALRVEGDREKDGLMILRLFVDGKCVAFGRSNEKTRMAGLREAVFDMASNMEHLA